MKSFFKNLSYCEKMILHKNAHLDTGEGTILYSEYTKHTLMRLIAFVESGKFTRAKSSKFVANHFRYDSDSMVKMWEQVFGTTKSNNTMRSQISSVSRELYEFFGDTFAEQLLNNKPDEVADMLNVLDVGTCYFRDLFPAELDAKIDSVSAYSSMPCDLTKEIAFLNRYRKDKLEHDLKGLDMHSLAWIKQAINEPLVVDHMLNYDKIEYLRQFNVAHKMNEGKPQEVCFPRQLIPIIKGSINVNLEGIDEFRKDELKRLFYLMYTKDGLKELLFGYSYADVCAALKEVKEGI